MKSREIVKRTINFNNPERVARSFKDSDFVHGHYSADTYLTEWKKIDENKWYKIDEWGNLWERIDPTSKGEVVKGILNDIDDIKNYNFPDYSKHEFYLSVKKQREKSPDKWLIGAMPGFTFNISRKLFKLETYLVNLMLEPDKISCLHNKIDLMLEHMIRNYAKTGVDSIMFPEDWGTQTQTIINPVIWYKEFFPRFKKLCSIAHEYGIKVFMHSCGKMTEIVPGLIKAGIDVLQFDQPSIHGINTLAAFQKTDKITFWCPVDIQKTLQTKNESKIRGEAQLMLDKLWKGRGGFIAGYYGDNVSIGINPKWQDIACDEFFKKGKNELYT